MHPAAKFLKAYFTEMRLIATFYWKAQGKPLEHTEGNTSELQWVEKNFELETDVILLEDLKEDFPNLPWIWMILNAVIFHSISTKILAHEPVVLRLLRICLFVNIFTLLYRKKSHLTLRNLARMVTLRHLWNYFFNLSLFVVANLYMAPLYALTYSFAAAFDFVYQKFLADLDFVLPTGRLSIWWLVGPPLVARLLILIHMIWESEYYISSAQSRSKIRQSFRGYLTDLLYSLTYGICVNLVSAEVRLLGFSFSWGYLGCFLFVALGFFISKFSWQNFAMFFYLNHKIMHVGGVMLQLHQEHHSATNQSALIGNSGTGLLELFSQEWGQLPFGSCLPRWFRFMGPVYWSNFLGHHYYPEKWTSLFYPILLKILRVQSYISFLYDLPTNMVGYLLKKANLFQGGDYYLINVKCDPDCPEVNEYGPEFRAKQYHSIHHWKSGKHYALGFNPTPELFIMLYTAAISNARKKQAE